MARILGLDLGSHTIKGVLFESTMRGYQTRAYATARRAPEGDKAETLRAAIGELKANPALQADQVVIALPGPSLATHVITLPFSDPKRIEQTLPFELESQLPFDLSEVVYDYQPAGQHDKKTNLIVGMARKDDLRSLLEQLAAANIDPRIITHPGVAYQNVLALQTPDPSLPAEQQAVAIVDIGHERTSVAIGVPGGPIEFARTFSGGGRDLTRALAAEFKTAAPDAEHWKEQYGALASHINGPDSERAAGALLRGLHGVVRELRQSFKSFTAKSRRNVGKVLLCGGTAKLAGIDEQLSSDLAIPVERLQLPNESGSVIPETEHIAAAQAYALALRAGNAATKGPRFNLRRSEFGFKGDFDYAREKIGRLVAFAATLLLLVIASGVVRGTMLSKREAAVDDQLCATTQKVLGRCEKVYDVALNMLKGKESPAAAVPKISAVTLLAELTARIPQEHGIKLDQVTVELDRISLRVTANNAKAVDTITQSLKKYRCFKEVQERKVEKTRDGQHVQFGMDIQVSCPGEEARS
ncbi:MAG: pilus assembly protein PilM [Myxococcaceae bacterium]